MDPRLEHALRWETRHRRMIAESLVAQEEILPLEESDLVADGLNKLRFLANLTVHSEAGPEDHPKGVQVALMKWTGGRLELVAKQGDISDSLCEELKLEWDEVAVMRKTLDRALDLFGYSCEAVPFSVGPDLHYVLIGLSGDPLPTHIRREVSRAATKLLAHHVYGEELPPWVSDRI